MAVALAIFVGGCGSAHPAKAAENREAGVRFELEGDRLRVEIDRDAPRSTRSLLGQTVVFACGRSDEFEPFLASARVRKRFAADKDAASVELPKDVSKSVAFCAIEGPGGERIYGFFVSTARLLRDTAERLEERRIGAGPPAACGKGKGHPLRVQTVLEKLREQGFQVNPVTDPTCAPRIVAEISNIHFRGPHENVQVHDRIQAREGHVICHVDESPILPGPTSTEVRKVVEQAQETTFFVANVSCYIDPAGDAPGEQVGKLERAARELASAARRA